MLHRPSLLERDKLAAGHPGPRAVPWGPRRRQRPLPTSGASGRPLLGDLRAPVLAPAPGVLRDAVAASALTSGHPAVSISVAGRLSPRLHGPGAGPGAGRGRAEPGGPDGLRAGDPCEGNLRTRVPDTSTASAVGARAHCQRGAQGVLGCVHGAGGRGAGARERRPVCFPGLCPLLSRQPARRHRPPPAPASPPARRPPPISSRPQRGVRRTQRPAACTHLRLSVPACGRHHAWGPRPSCGSGGGPAPSLRHLVGHRVTCWPH